MASELWIEQHTTETKRVLLAVAHFYKNWKVVSPLSNKLNSLSVSWPFFFPTKLQLCNYNYSQEIVIDSRQGAISKAPCEELETIPYLTVSKKVLLQINSDMLQGLPLALVASYRKSKFDRELCSDHLNRKREIFWRKLHPWDEDCFTWKYGRHCMV